MSAEVVFIVDRLGQSRAVDAAIVRTEAWRVGEARACGAVPASCGDEIPCAPARGPVLAFTPREMVTTYTGGRVSRHAGYMGRDAARCYDAFDHMTLQSARAGGAATPFTHGQVSAGRDYAALVERCAASGVKCSSLEALRAARSGGGDREEAMLADFQRLRVLRRRIGDGLAKDSLRPSRGGSRSAIRVRDLVDQVCCGGRTLAEILCASGWAKDARVIKVLRRELCAALDRMQGYDLAKPQNLD